MSILTAEGFLSVSHLDKENLFSFFDAIENNSKTIDSSLVGCLCFFEASTRTRVSFEKAGLDLGIRWVHLTGSSETSSKKGESQQDSFEVLSNYDFDFFVVRHSQNYFSKNVHAWTSKPVINAGDGTNEHPTQALGDVFTLWQRDRKRAWKILFYGDFNRSRVAHSNAILMKKLGWNVAVLDDGSAELSQAAEKYEIEIVSKKSAEEFDIIYALRLQTERGSSESAVSMLTKQDLHSHQMLMHPGPVIWGRDLSEDLKNLSAKRSLILTQVENCYRIRREILREL